VDWGSSPPYSEYLPPYILDNPKRKLVTVTDQPLYYLTWAIRARVMVRGGGGGRGTRAGGS
jgi:hypothetical protein